MSKTLVKDLDEHLRVYHNLALAIMPLRRATDAATSLGSAILYLETH